MGDVLSLNSPPQIAKKGRDRQHQNVSDLGNYRVAFLFFLQFTQDNIRKVIANGNNFSMHSEETIGESISLNLFVFKKNKKFEDN